MRVVGVIVVTVVMGSMFLVTNALAQSDEGYDGSYRAQRQHLHPYDGTPGKPYPYQERVQRQYGGPYDDESPVLEDGRDSAYPYQREVDPREDPYRQWRYGHDSLTPEWMLEEKNPENSGSVNERPPGHVAWPSLEQGVQEGQAPPERAMPVVRDVDPCVDSAAGMNDRRLHGPRQDFDREAVQNHRLPYADRVMPPLPERPVVRPEAVRQQPPEGTYRNWEQPPAVQPQPLLEPKPVAHPGTTPEWKREPAPDSDQAQLDDQEAYHAEPSNGGLVPRPPEGTGQQGQDGLPTIF